MKKLKEIQWTDQDLHLFNEGRHFRLYDKMGSHEVQDGSTSGIYFSVWAPNAESISVIGDFNQWIPGKNPLAAVASAGIWDGFIPGLTSGMKYKYQVRSRMENYTAEKSDPFGQFNEGSPGNSSVIWKKDHVWNDSEWMRKRKDQQKNGRPISIYEVHLGSWSRVSEDANRSLSYLELAEKLPQYVQKMGFTHVEFLPVMEHPFYASWGYQVTGFFSPTSRYGTPEEFKYLIDRFHQLGIGVLLDWVPSHFPSDINSLGYFDGTFLYEHADAKQRTHPDWGSLLFNYGRNEVRSFLISNALFWLDHFHADGLRVDAVASMLYLDYSRKEGEWIANAYGGRENLEAMEFLKQLNQVVYQEYPDVHTIAEESTSWPQVSRPTYTGGLGFGMKWDMGWMNDTLSYFEVDPVYRKHHHNQITFRMVYAFSENFVLPFSHDEVVHGKGSLLGKMPGDDWQKFANLRCLFCYLYAQPGKKLMFMGSELAPRKEWNHDTELDWKLEKEPWHGGIQNLVRDLNKTYQNFPSLHEMDFQSEGFEWADCNDSQNSVIAFYRNTKSKNQQVLAIFNFTPVPRDGYRLGVPNPGVWLEILNSDATIYGGSGIGNLGKVSTNAISSHGHAQSVELNLPPLAGIFLLWEGGHE